MEVLDKENVPKIIREPGRAESFLKSDAPAYFFSAGKP